MIPKTFPCIIPAWPLYDSSQQIFKELYITIHQCEHYFRDMIWTRNLSRSNDVDKTWIEADIYGSPTTRQILDVSHLNFFEQISSILKVTICSTAVSTWSTEIIAEALGIERYMHEMTCRINCLSFAKNLKQLHQYSVTYRMYLDLEIDSIFISTYSGKQCKKAKYNVHHTPRD